MTREAWDVLTPENQKRAIATGVDTPVNEAVIESKAPVVVENNAVSIAGGTPFDISAKQFSAALQKRAKNRQALLKWVKDALVDGVDFGAVKTKRGMSKPSLRKPGAEKIAGMLGLSVVFPGLLEYERTALAGNAIKNIVLRCQLVDGGGSVLAEGVGARSLVQDAGDLNKALKMVEKSAHIDAVLRLAGLSEVFTQDIEDMIQNTAIKEDAPPAPVASVQPAKPVESGEITADDTKRLYTLINNKLSIRGFQTSAKAFDERLHEWLFNNWAVSSVKQLSKADFDVLYQRIPKFVEKFIEDRIQQRDAIQKAQREQELEYAKAAVNSHKRERQEQAYNDDPDYWRDATEAGMDYRARAKYMRDNPSGKAL